LAVQFDAGSCPVLKLSPQANARIKSGRAHFCESIYDLTRNSNLTDGTKASFFQMCGNNSNTKHYLNYSSAFLSLPVQVTLSSSGQSPLFRRVTA